jgi:hypothetical protein
MRDLHHRPVLHFGASGLPRACTGVAECCVLGRGTMRRACIDVVTRAPSLALRASKKAGLKRRRSTNLSAISRWFAFARRA